MIASQLPASAQPAASPPSARPRNGLGVAALVVGVASLVAAVSFTLFPLGLVGGLVAAALGGIAVSRGRTSSGQAVAGIVCGALALVLGIVFAVRFGTFVAHNTGVFTTFDKCIAKAGSNRSAISGCIARLANGIR